MPMHKAAMLAQTERRLIHNRTQAWLAEAKARGRKGGRPQTAGDDARVLMAKKMSKNQGISIGEICGTLKISRATYYRYLGL